MSCRGHVLVNLFDSIFPILIDFHLQVTLERDKFELQVRVAEQMKEVAIKKADWADRYSLILVACSHDIVADSDSLHLARLSRRLNSSSSNSLPPGMRLRGSSTSHLNPIVA